MKNEGDFYALLFRMKSITRWGLMYNTRPENLSEHAAECAILSHALAIQANRRFGASFDTNRLLAAGLYHDISEVLTGDLPTPVKYYNNAIKNSYKEIEHTSLDKMLSLLDEESAAVYAALFDLTEDEKRLLKAADKLCALIKCLQELERGNGEFASARRVNEKALRDMKMPVVDYFLEFCLPSFVKTIDEVRL